MHWHIKECSIIFKIKKLTINFFNYFKGKLTEKLFNLILRDGQKVQIAGFFFAAIFTCASVSEWLDIYCPRDTGKKIYCWEQETAIIRTTVMYVKTAIYRGKNYAIYRAKIVPSPPRLSRLLKNYIVKSVRSKVYLQKRVITFG